MTYKVMAVGDDWVELWDGETIIDPDLPRHKSLDLFYIGEHSFQEGDTVDLMVRLVARITPPGEDELILTTNEHGNVIDYGPQFGEEP